MLITVLQIEPIATPHTAVTILIATCSTPCKLNPTIQPRTNDTMADATKHCHGIGLGQRAHRS